MKCSKSSPVFWCIGAAVLFAASSLAERQFYYVNELKNWTAAQSVCREQFVDLVTLSSLENVTTLVDMTDVKKMVDGHDKHVNKHVCFCYSFLNNLVFHFEK